MTQFAVRPCLAAARTTKRGNRAAEPDPPQVPAAEVRPLSGSRVGPAPVLFAFPAARNANVEKCRQKGGAVNCHLPRKQC